MITNFIESYTKLIVSNPDAIKVSQVPAYKELAKKIGLELMKENIEKLNYGNKNIGTEIDSFWLQGPLKINAFEQIELLSLLAQKNYLIILNIKKKFLRLQF